jgi:hypothetical protein
MLTYSSWIDGQNKLAHSLASGACGGTYGDGAIVLCVSISAMASLRWIKKDRTDRRRFIEIVARSSQVGFDPTIVSAPLLAQENNSWKPKLGVSDKAFYYTQDNDKSENDIIALCDAAMTMRERKKFARNYSYACLLYEHIRCGFIHTYRPTEAATNDDALRAVFDAGGAKVTYVNSLQATGMRKIYFPLEWVSMVAKNIAADLDTESNRHNKNFGENLDLAVPRTWWIDGA